MLTVAVFMVSCEQEAVNGDFIENTEDLSLTHSHESGHETHTNCGGECHVEPEYTMEMSVKLPFAEKETTVTVGVANGLVYYEGDIILGNLKDIQEKGVAKDSQRWTNSTIPYVIGSGFSSTQITRINDAIANVNANTNLCVVPRAGEANYVEFITSSGCASSVGMKGGKQNIKLAPGCSYGSTIHEILHASGVWHEQSREDRNDYVTIHEENIKVGKEGNFYQQIIGSSDYGAYDYGSIMHYGTHYFSANGQPTITTIPPGIPIGQRTALSAGDISTVNTMYSGCTACTPEQPTIGDLYSVSGGCDYAYPTCYYHEGDYKQFQMRKASNNSVVGYEYTTSYYVTFNSGLTPSTQYKYRVRMKCGTTGSYGAWSPYKWFWTPSCN